LTEAAASTAAVVCTEIQDIDDLEELVHMAMVVDDMRCAACEEPYHTGLADKPG
jgi:hypothetical protein